MKTVDLRKKSPAEMRQELSALLREQFNLRMQTATGQNPKGHLLRNVRRNIARVKTVMNEKRNG